MSGSLTRPVGRPRINTMEPTPIGLAIRRERQRQGWSLWHLARLSGRAPQTISAIERGESQNPQVRTLLPILDALGIARGKALGLLAPKEDRRRQRRRNGRKRGKPLASPS